MKRYEKYKPSGIEWLGEIPEHWEVKRVKDLTFKIGSGVTPNGGAEVYSDSGIPFFRSQNIYNNRLSVDDIVYISEEIDDRMSNSRIRPNDLLLNITGASIGRCFYVSGDFKRGNVNQHVCIIRPNQKAISTKYLHLLFISQYGQILIDICQNGANREGLNFQQIKNFQFPILQLSEQSTIANYLDTKTTAIDRKIELLTAKAEKYKALRRSLINETVCRGLNPKAALKDSEVEWIGKIPKHWEVKRVKEIFRNTGSGTTPPSGDQTYYDDNGFYWLQTGDLNDSIIVDTSKKISKKAMDEFSTLKGYPVNSLVIAMYGATIGKMGYLRINTTTNQACCVLTKPIGNNSQYLFYQFLTMKQFIVSLSTGGGQPNINQDIVRFLMLCIPPLSEQIAISKYLDDETTQIDNILINIGEQINKLSQLRKTLINDVVTGKIKATEDLL